VIKNSVSKNIYLDIEKVLEHAIIARTLAPEPKLAIGPAEPGKILCY